MGTAGSRRALVLEHVRHEDVAGLRAPIEAAGYRIDAVHVPGTRLGAEIRTADLVVVMGGPMGAYEGDGHPWLADEITALAQRIVDGRPTLGICLGAQLIAVALGARVYPGPVKEIGFAPIALSMAAQASPLRHLAGISVLHWHGDTFDLPDGAKLLASTELYANQAFRRGSKLLALQFHPEMGGAPGLDAWVEGSEAYVAEGGTDAAQLLADYARHGAAAVRAGQAMVAEWLMQLDP